MANNDTTTTTAAKPARARRAKATANATPAPATTEPTFPAVAPTPAPTAKTASKSDSVIKLLLRAKGATPTELIATTDWQPHSLRAFLSGLRKKGRSIVREERKGGGFAYRIVVAATEPANGSSTGDGKPLADAGHGADVRPTDPGVIEDARSAIGTGEA